MNNTLEILKMICRVVGLTMTGFAIHLLYKIITTVNSLVIETNLTHKAIEQLYTLLHKSIFF
jgi:hypothetical protein